MRWFPAWMMFAPLGLASAAPTDTALTDNAIIVTATRLPEPQADVLASTLVIDRDAIEQSVASDPGDLLRFHAGLDLGRNGGPGQTTAVFIRGADSNHTMVLVDGVRINPGTIGLAPLQTLDPASIERIEVVKGPRSALWGTDAIGGVVNIITRRPAADTWSATAGYGDYQTRQASLSGGLPVGPAVLGLGVNWTDSQGFPTRTDDHVDRGFHNLSGTASLRGTVGDADLAMNYWRASGRTEYSDFYLAPVDEDFDNSVLAASATLPLADGLDARLGASHYDDATMQNQSTDYLRTRRDELDAQLDWRVASQVLSAGAMDSREQASSRSYGEAYHADTHWLNLYAQDQVDSGPHRALAAVGYTDHETAGQAWTWNLEYGYTLAGRTQLYGLGGTGYRAPDATDRYGYGGNPELQPERSINLETGIRHRFSATQSGSVAYFRNQIHDLIEFVVTSWDPFGGLNQNVDRARIQGVEAAYEYAAGPWRARVEAIHQDPRNLTTGERLYRRAEDSVTLNLARSLGRLQLGLDVLATGARKDYGYPGPVTLSGYVLANLTARWRPTPALTVSARVENLLNQQYELADGYNTPDRGLYVTVGYAVSGSAQAQTALAVDPGGDTPDPRSAYSRRTTRTRTEH
jgi:vitamin B12 transporter